MKIVNLKSDGTIFDINGFVIPADHAVYDLLIEIYRENEKVKKDNDNNKDAS